MTARYGRVGRLLGPWDAEPAARAVGVLLAVAGILHAFVAGDHISRPTTVRDALLVVGIMQFLFGVGLLLEAPGTVAAIRSGDGAAWRRARRVAFAAAALNAAVLAVGSLPSPAAAVLEVAAALPVVAAVAVAAQAALVAACLLLLTSRELRRPPSDRPLQEPGLERPFHSQ